MQRTVLYCRKSSDSDDRQVQSLDDQETELRDFVKRVNGFAQNSADQMEIVEIIKESCSAKNSGERPLFNKMIDEAQKKKYDAILIWAPDRMTRNLGDMDKIIRLLEGHKIKHVLTQSNQTYGNRAIEKGMLQYCVVNAKMENDQKGENVVRGLKRKIRDGNWIGNARLGYLNFGNKKGQRWVDKDPERWEIIKQCWEMFATGAYSVPQIRDKAEELGLRSRPMRNKPEGARVGINTYYDMFWNVFYLGKMFIGKKEDVKLLPELKTMLLNGEIEGEIFEDYVIVKGKHPPMISEEMFRRVQGILRERGLANHCTTAKFKDFVFAGLILCGACGHAVVTEEKTKYKCTDCGTWFTCSSARPTPTDCKHCKKPLSRQALENSSYYCYAHCSGKNKQKKFCPQTFHPNGRPKPTIPVVELEKQVDDMLNRLSMDEEVYAYCIGTLKDEHFQNKIVQNQSLTLLQRDHKRIKEKVDKLVDLRLAGEIDADYFANKKSELETNIKEIMQQLEKFNQKNTDWVEQTETFLNMASRASLAFKKGDNPTKREILKSISSHIYLQGGKLRFEFRKPFDILLKEPPKQALNSVSKKQEFEPKEHQEKAKIVAFGSRFSDWLPRLGSNQ